MIITNNQQILLIKRLLELDNKSLRSKFKEKFLRYPKLNITREDIVNCLFLFIQAEIFGLNNLKIQTLQELDVIFQKVPENTCETELEKRVKLFIKKKTQTVQRKVHQKEVYLEEKPGIVDSRSWQERNREKKQIIKEESQKANPVIWGKIGSAERYVLLKLAQSDGITLKEIALGLCSELPKYANRYDNAIARVRYAWYCCKNVKKGIIFECDDLPQKKKRIRFIDFADNEKGKELKERHSRSLVLSGNQENPKGD